jgi:hypothetical protein
MSGIVSATASGTAIANDTPAWNSGSLKSKKNAKTASLI